MIALPEKVRSINTRIKGTEKGDKSNYQPYCSALFSGKADLRYKFGARVEDDQIAHRSCPQLNQGNSHVLRILKTLK